MTKWSADPSTRSKGPRAASTSREPTAVISAPSTISAPSGISAAGPRATTGSPSTRYRATGRSARDDHLVQHPAERLVGLFQHLPFVDRGQPASLHDDLAVDD